MTVIEVVMDCLVLPIPDSLEEMLHVDALILDLNYPWMLHHLPWHVTILWRFIQTVPALIHRDQDS